MEKLKNQLVDACNQSGLPLEAIFFVVKDFYRDITDFYVEAKERANREQDTPKEKEEEDIVE